ncbi:YihY/virulence factor BrkB family protein [Glaciihabitans arcticus]|uniref:YihY/virulence factor BrkB family protein n=2 Tax=Glaciihabitans arcticus TaxID=2668039 RepID=A0A4Q9GYZ0_9MICO|nr:YihY/virulence factor BrkB family protein [Glaciihabitans arcticus]
MRHRGLDSAAALTFFAALALFPATLTVVSSFALLNNRENAIRNILSVANEFVTEDTVETLRDPLTSLLSIGNPGLAFAIGLSLTLWSVSSYATAFGRAVNTVYEVQEGRPIWKFRGLMMLVTLLLMIGFALIVVILLGTPSAARTIGEAAGFGEPWLTVWNVGKWPALAALAFSLVAVLYYATPNVRHSRLRWVSWGAAFALLAWGVATLAFAVYVMTVGTYDKVYGWIGGGLALLVWLYITNLVLVIGAEVDGELVRVRQLAAGIPAEDTIQLPARDTTRTLMLARQRADDVREGREIREKASRPSS